MGRGQRERSEESEGVDAALAFKLHASYHCSSITGHPFIVLPLTSGREKSRVGVISNRERISSADNASIFESRLIRDQVAAQREHRR